MRLVGAARRGAPRGTSLARCSRTARVMSLRSAPDRRGTPASNPVDVDDAASRRDAGDAPALDRPVLARADVLDPFEGRAQLVDLRGEHAAHDLEEVGAQGADEGPEPPDLRGEGDARVRHGDVQRLRAEAVAREVERPSSRVPPREREHPVEAGNGRLYAPACDRVEDDLGVAGPAEDDALAREVGAQLGVVDDLAVVDEDALPARGDRGLGGRLRRTAHAQAGVRERDGAVAPDAATAGPPVPHCAGHPTRHPRPGVAVHRRCPRSCTWRLPRRSVPGAPSLPDAGWSVSRDRRGCSEVYV